MPISNPIAATLKSKMKPETRDLAAASGDVAYTGYGFQPNCLQIIGCFDISAGISFGFADKTGADQCIQQKEASKWGTTANLIEIRNTTGDGQTAILKSFDADGFTLTWTKIGTLTGVKSILVLALKVE